MRTWLEFAAALVLIPLVAKPSISAPPKVVKAIPDNGARDVDPSVKEIRITFDQEMGEGMSVVGGGELFPEILGKPQWATARTFVIPVRLQPNHDFQLSINSERFRNFTNRGGEPALPYPICFRTGAGKGAAAEIAPDVAAKELTSRDNRRAVNMLRSAIRDHYSYRDRLKIDWDDLLKKHQDELIAAESPHEFAAAAAKLLAQAKDKHIWLQVGKENIPTYVRPMTPNANFKLLPQLVPNLQLHGRAVLSGRWDDGIGYLAIGSWDRARLNGGQDVFAALDELRDCRALVLDVRANGGGAEPMAQEVAGCFVNERCLYAKHVYRNPKTAADFSAPSERWLAPNATRPHFAGRVAVLSGPVVMSSGEAFLLMMKQVPGAVLVGAASQGSSGNPKPHDLRNGVTVYLPSWKAMAPDGTELEGVGIAPDRSVTATPADFQGADPVLAAALAHLRSTKPR